jgi:hypothetical protein
LQFLINRNETKKGKQNSCLKTTQVWNIGIESKDKKKLPDATEFIVTVVFEAASPALSIRF